jgi:hypothetical protein
MKIRLGCLCLWIESLTNLGDIYSVEHDDGWRISTVPRHRFCCAVQVRFYLFLYLAYVFHKLTPNLVLYN